MKVLIVEDDAAIAKLYKTELVSKGYQVEVAPNGDLGIAKAKQWHPDLALVDIMMPKTNGIDVLKAIKADPDIKNTIIIMLTNFGQEDLVKDAINGGADEYVLKYQITPAEVADKVKQHLAKVSSPA